MSFTAEVSEYVAQSKVAMTAIFRQSAQEVTEEMLKVGPSVASTRAARRTAPGRIGPPTPAGEGGHMPVDTGFLRASLLASTRQMPQVRSDAAPVEGMSYPPTNEAVNLVINSTELGETLYVGFVAAYARRVNYGFTGTDSLGRSYSQQGYLFVENAAQQWDVIVDRVASRFMREAGIA